MALNYRRPASKIINENATSNLITGKTINPVGKETGLTKRPALCEIKNQISHRDSVAKKAPIVAKPDVKVSKTTTLVQKETKKVTLNVLKPEVTKKTAITTKFETECKIKEVTEPKSFSSQRYDAVEEEIIGNDPQFVPEYIHDIFSYLRSLEDKYKIDSQFLTCHKTTTRMRSILVNWLVEVQINFKLLPETLHLCVAIVDRYLQKNKSIGRDNLQLVGITALWLAGKYEEMYIPESEDFVYICDNSFSVTEMMKMELSIIKTLNYSFGRPLSLHFLRRYSRISNVQPQEHLLAKYLVELALIEQDLCHIKPSLQAAAAMYLSLSVLNEDSRSNKTWSKALVHYSGYGFADIEKVVKLMAESVIRQEQSKHQAIRNKYATSTNMKISQIAELKGPVIKKFAQKL